MTRAEKLEEIEYVAKQLHALREAENLAKEADPKSLPEIQKLIDSGLDRLIELAKWFLGSSPKKSLGARKSEIALEVHEWFFAVLREQAESEWARSLKLRGKRAKASHKKADVLGRLAQQAAQGLMRAAKAEGKWNDEYIAGHGLGPWVE